MHSSHVALAIPALAFAAGAAAKGVWTTPHDKYSSSIGVLGCKINTNRVAYWPGSVDCNNICIKLSYSERTVHLLRIDQSQGAYDISYDAWNYLQTGQSAVSNPISGGPVAMEYEEVDASECAGLIHTDGSKLPLSAANSINFLSSCLSQPSSWIAKNHVLYNIGDAICTVGFDEVCTLDMAVSNQPSCPHTLGLTTKLTTAPVYDVSYQTGKMVTAGTGAAAPADAQVPDETSDGGSPAAQGTDEGSAHSVSSAAATTSAAAAIFVEVPHSSSSSSSTTTTTTTTNAVPTPPVETTTSTSAAAATTSSSVTSAVSSQASSFAPSQTPTTMAVPTGSYTNKTSPDTTSQGGSKPSGQGVSTVSVVTLSSTRTAAGGSASSTASNPPANAGQASASIPALTLVSSIIMCAVLSLI